jgi:hypothetical protein
MYDHDVGPLVVVHDLLQQGLRRRKRVSSSVNWSVGMPQAVRYLVVM